MQFYIHFFFIDPATTEIYTLSLHDALPISAQDLSFIQAQGITMLVAVRSASAVRLQARLLDPSKFASSTGLETLTLDLDRSEEHTSELQSRRDLVCRLLLEKKNMKEQNHEE